MLKKSVLLHKSQLYVATQYQMNLYSLAYLNNENYRRIVRRKRPSEDATSHNDIIQHTAAMPIARYVIDTINDTVFEPGIDRDIRTATETGVFLDPDTQDWTELFQLDADLSNTSLNGVMEHIGDLTSIFGHCWVGVDMPQDVDTKYARPYVCSLSPLQVWDYELINVRGSWIPQYVKVLERETPECYYFKCYFLGTSTQPSYWQSYEVEKQEQNVTQTDSDIAPLEEGTFPLGMSIPLFMAFTKRDPRRIDMGISDIDVAADIQSEIYKLECEAYSSIQFARTLIRADNGIKVPAQAGSIVRATQGQIEAIAIEQQDVNTIINKQQQLLENFQQLTGLGGLTKTSQQVQSGVSIIEERKQLHRMAKAKARLLENCEEAIWTYACRFMGVRWAGEVSYSQDYEQHDTRYRMALISQAKSLMPDNEVINSLVLKELIKMLAPQHEVSEYQMAIRPMLDPVIQKLEQEEDAELATRDIGNQTPDSLEQDSMSEMKEEAEKEAVATLNPSIINTGRSYYVEDAVASQLGFGGFGAR